MRRVFLAHPSSLEHDTGGHPENATRIIAIERELEQRGWLGYERVASPPVDRAALNAVHPERYVEAIERVSAQGGGYLDLDTVVSAGSFGAALHAAGGAVRMVEMLLDGEAAVAFSAHRPPGHHATSSRAMGFCLFNHVAVAARHALAARGIDRVMILDWDVHHGNGSNDIFHASDQVLFVSIHQSPLYPGTGHADDVGSGSGSAFTVNLPVPPGTGDADYVSLIEHVVAPLARSFQPQLVLISAGFDAHLADQLADCRVSEGGFARMAACTRRVCEEVGAPVGAVLEGGYALDPLGKSVAATMEALGDASSSPAGAESGLTPLAREARSRVALSWPALAV